ncbi:hypothetical protein [Luteipulveratus mongoliensis]|uniref:DUF8017 domain-containing protein n=1 Tax=Luteipulveratus mongoliensis TaxID=571913 RepID=A0A0K1JMV3_9MICO|nr:hypothetical protein [Luteipulveratus mongoliensis]AKU18049.1 hypothetical protein VV02_22925 [Luteipulveratus mongoliensis]
MSNNDGNGWPPSQGGGQNQPGQGQPGQGQPGQGQQGPPPQRQDGYVGGTAGPTDAQRFGGSFGESWREQEFGHGQDRYYGDIGQQGPQSYADAPVEHGAPPSGPIGSVGGGGRRTALLAAAAVAAVAVLGGGGYALYQGSKDDKPDPAAQTSSQPPSPTATESSPTSAPSPTSDSGGGIGTKNVPPIVPGWQANYADKDGDLVFNAAFDVPPAGSFTPTGGVGKAAEPEWKLGKITTSEGFGELFDKSVPTATGRKPADYRDGYCTTNEGSSLATFVFQFSGDRDPVDIAPDATTKWAKAIAYKKNKTYEKYTEGTPQQIKVNGGKTVAVQTRTTIPNTEPDPKKCSAPKMELVVTSFTSGNATATVVGVRKVGIANALDNATWEKILASARPVAP